MDHVQFPANQLGMNAKVLLARRTAALTKANGNLDCSRKWYGKIREGYGK
jgi:hypothetical protein